LSQAPSRLPLLPLLPPLLLLLLLLLELLRPVRAAAPRFFQQVPRSARGGGSGVSVDFD
jgi:hypothetical protein